MYTSQQSTDFNQRVVLGNCYWNCFHLMCCVEKSTWYIKQKRVLARDTPCKVPGTTTSLALRGFNTVDHVFFSCACSYNLQSLPNHLLVVMCKAAFVTLKVVLYFDNIACLVAFFFTCFASYSTWDFQNLLTSIDKPVVIVELCYIETCLLPRPYLL